MIESTHYLRSRAEKLGWDSLLLEVFLLLTKSKSELPLTSGLGTETGKI
jgi:hypothetical protein